MNGGPKFSIPETNKTLKVNRGGDGSHSCKRISDFMLFIKVMEHYVNHFTYSGNTERYISN